MRKFNATILALALLLSGATAWAETETATDEPRFHLRLERMQNELKLDDKQVQEVRKIFEDMRPQMEALRKQGQELREKMRERIKTVLTAEQMEKFDRLRRERMQERMGRHGHGMN
jgi:Spy/CpxP family protein refolding chaperone